jgi:hypothetical protein
MPSVKNSSLLLHLQVFQADNNIRRGIQTVATNVQASDEGIVDRTKVLDPLENFSFDCVPDNKVTVIRCSAPLDVTLVQGVNTLTFTVTSLLIFTDHVDDLSFSNLAIAGTDPVRLRITQA